MRFFLHLTAILLIYFPLSASHYWTISNGGTLSSPENPFLLERYPQHFTSYDTRGMPSFETRHIEVKGKYKPGTRLSVASGIHFYERYRIELEMSFAKDKISLKHEDPHGPRLDPIIKQRQLVAGCVNIGGHLLSVGKVSPYSMIGIGMRSSYVQGHDMEAVLCYQWLLGADVEVFHPLCVFMQHRMQKALKKDGIHSFEVGVKLHH
jgi:hypothetical protein